MIKIIEKSITTPAGETVTNDWDFSQKVNDRLGIVKQIVCLNDLTALRQNYFLKLKKDNSEFVNFDEIDVYGLSTAFKEKTILDNEAGLFKATVKNFSESSVTLYFQATIEY